MDTISEWMRGRRENELYIDDVQWMKTCKYVLFTIVGSAGWDQTHYQPLTAEQIVHVGIMSRVCGKVK